MSEAQKSDQWAVVELFGHARIAGRISEQTIGGQSFVRIDVPTVKYVERGYGGEPETEHVIAAHTRSFGAGAIYSINWVDEPAATLAAHSIKHAPISPYALKDALRSMGDTQRQRMLGAPVRDLVDGDAYDD